MTIRGRTAVRSRPDVRALGAGVSYPGIDPRVWLTLATVVDVGFDSNNGIFVDVKYQPDGTDETALLTAQHTGTRCGSYRPVKEGDTVVVAVPKGDPGNGPVIIARCWNAGDPPAAEMGDGDDAVNDWIDVLDTDSNYVMKTQGEGIIKWQAADQSFVRGDDQKDAIDTFADELNTWAVAVAAGIVNAGGAINADAQARFLEAITSFKTSITNALSTKIKGE